MPYTKTIWDENTPITPARLNNLESQYDEAIADTTARPEITLYVNASTGNDNNDGLSSATALKTIGKAIEKAQKAIAAYITINVAAGTYTGNLTINNILASRFVIEGPPVGGVAVINGMVQINNVPRIQINRMTISGGTYGVTGGLAVGEVRLTNVTIQNISSIGVFLEDTKAYISNCTINAPYCIRVARVGVLYVQEVALSATYVGISINTASVAYASNLTGNLGSVPVFEVNAAILFKGSSTITGGTDEKSNGGQIFEDA